MPKSKWDFSSRVRPPSLPKSPTVPRGPRWEQSLRSRAKQNTGPGSAPDGFVGGTTSSVEWVFYWALFKAFAPNSNPRTPPFWGIDGVFRYQKNFQGGRSPGGQVIDFVVEYGPHVRVRTGIRIQTYQYHEKGTRQIEADRVRKGHIASVMDVVDVWDYQLLLPNGTAGDGQQAIIVAKQAVGMIDPISRLAAGNVRAVRYQAAKR